MAEPFIRPDVKPFLDFLNSQPGPQMHEIGHVEARKGMAAMRGLADADTGALAILRDLTMPAPGGGTLRLRLFDPRASRAPGPVLLFFHGGGFVLGDLDSHEPGCAEIARALDIPVVAVDYRLAPEHPWPAAPDDAEAAARWIAESPSELGLAVTSLVLAGDSAGGTLTIVTAMALRDRPAAVPVVAQFPLYPAADLEMRGESHAIRRRLSAVGGRDGLVHRMLSPRFRRLARIAAEGQPGRHARDAGGHRRARSAA